MIPLLTRINDPSMKWIEKRAFIAHYMNDTIKRIKKEKTMLASMDEASIHMNYSNFVKNPAVLEYIKNYDEARALYNMKEDDIQDQNLVKSLYTEGANGKSK